MKDKIVTLQELKLTLSYRKKKRERVVFTNGCFDLLHIGHVRYLQAAKELADILVVAVNSDSSIQFLGKSKGRPLVPETQRMEILAALNCVDYVLMFDQPDPLKIITEIQPDALVKGGDWPIDQIVGKDIVEARGGKVHSIPWVPNISTSLIIERIHALTSKPNKQEPNSTSKPAPSSGTHSEE